MKISPHQTNNSSAKNWVYSKERSLPSASSKDSSNKTTLPSLITSIGSSIGMGINGGAERKYQNISEGTLPLTDEKVLKQAKHLCYGLERTNNTSPRIICSVSVTWPQVPIRRSWSLNNLSSISINLIPRSGPLNTHHKVLDNLLNCYQHLPAK